MKIKNIIQHIIVLLTGVTFLMSCGEAEEQLFDDKDAFFAFEGVSTSIEENDSKALEIPVYISKSVPVGSVSFEIDTEGIDDKAVEGVDFTIEPSGYSLDFGGDFVRNIKIKTIDNDLEDGVKQFRIKLVQAGSTEKVGMANNDGVSFLVTINDDEHPFAHMFGNYDAYETTIEKDSPNEYMYEVKVSGHRDPDKLVFSGIWGVYQDITVQLDPESNLIWIMEDQEFTDIYFNNDILVGYADLVIKGWHWGEKIVDGEVVEVVIREPKAVGTYDEDTGFIEFSGGYVLNFSKVSNPNLIGKSFNYMIQDYFSLTKQ